MKTEVDKLKSGDIVIHFFKNGSLRLGICTKALEVYDRQGGEGAILRYEDGSTHQFSYYSYSGQEYVAVIGHVEKLEENPLRQLLVWRQQFEK